MSLSSINLTQKLLSGLLICFMCIFAQAAYAQSQTKQETPAGTKFWLYTPPGYTASNDYPMLVSLHGSGTIGDDLDAMLTFRDEIPAKLIKNGRWPESRPFIVVTPQLQRDLSVPDERDQLFSPEMIDELIEYVKLNWSVNNDRIYLTGLSLGGASVWLYAAAHPEKVAAIVPISGVTDTTQACMVKDIPVWVFHGGMDELVPNVYSQGMARNINQCSPRAYNAQLTMTHARRHEGWNEIYMGHNGYDIYDWLLKFTKNDLSNKTPYVNAGLDLKLLSRTAPLTLYGEYFDADGSVASVSWSQVSGPAATLSGTTTRWLTVSNLVTGTYVFQLSATDDDGAVSSDQVTVQILSTTPVGQASISDLILMNGATNQDIGPLSEGYIIDPTLLGTNQFNIRAIPTSAPTQSSVKIGVNGDQATRITNPPGPYVLISQPPNLNVPEWIVSNGTYRICATPSDARNGYGNPGVSQCFTVTVTNLAPGAKFYYAKPSSNISSLSSWGPNPDGTGTAPTSFTADNQIFSITTTTSSGSAVAVTGTGSGLWVRSGGSLTINAQATGLHVDANATVTINTSQAVTFGTVHPSATIIFGTGATTIPADQYGNISITGSGSTKTLSAGTTQISGDLTIASGVTLDAGSAQLTIGGDFINNGSFTEGTSSVTFNGSGEQALTGTNSFHNLVVSNTGGNIVLSGTGATSVTNALTLTQGHIVSSATNILSLGLAATISGGSSSSFISGPILKALAASGTFTFPAGSISPLRYRPVVLANTSGADSWTIEYSGNSPTDDGYAHTQYNNTTLSRVSQFEYWDISRAGSASATVTLSFGPGSYTPPNIGEADELRIAHWDDTRWDIPTGNGTLSRTGDNISGTLTVTNVTSFSPFTIGGFDGPLPVTWASFEAERVNQNIRLAWTTATEENNDHFKIERSVDGKNFQSVGMVKGAGNSRTPQQYQFTDGEITSSITYYYRLRQVDYDGRYDFSKVVAVYATQREQVRWIAYPNPVEDSHVFRIELQDQSIDASRMLGVQVLSPSGTLMFEDRGTLQEVNQRLRRVMQMAKQSMYIIRLSDGDYHQYFRVVRL